MEQGDTDLRKIEYCKFLLWRIVWLWNICILLYSLDGGLRAGLKTLGI
ncbi:hypothetical protein LBBP_02911 [Leptospira borgpetersenii serovar Ballum]|uniref:Uncharacterized protein n=1 Tax=Leptospira borgpetersenii serovar Ballum TaxID=280505 RepID=A0A0S2IU00_LEPBO|nr:hypothetical protein LBBP_02911 [Leptospira borgpetersenii serovar Ballum]